MEERLIANSWMPDDSDCWVWIGKRVANCRGVFYGVLNVRRNGKHQTVKAHRESYCTFLGVKKLAPSTVIRHTCDNTLCINPAHLLRGTQAQNVADAQRRGRRP